MANDHHTGFDVHGKCESFEVKHLTQKLIHLEKLATFNRVSYSSPRSFQHQINLTVKTDQVHK